jgi:glycogen(starch) synthase
VLEPAVLEHLRVSPDRVRVIPNALDLRWIDGLSSPHDAVRVRRAAGLGSKEIVLLSVGRLEQNKGLHVLAAALGALRKHSGPVRDDEWRWVIIGDGPFRGRLERSVADAGLRDRTLFIGPTDDSTLHAWYEAATLFVHPTLYEGSSLVTLEAMAHRRAVVATTAGGLPDKVKPGVNGWLVLPGDPSALAAAVSGAIADPERLIQMGEAGRRLIVREFSWDAAVAATLRLYEEVLQ